MSDLFSFKGAEGAGYAQPDPISDDFDFPSVLQRQNLPRWPRASEPEIVRHYTWLSTRSHGIDSGVYPLGSCTMKHNPRINEKIVLLAGMNDIHPLAPETHLQGLMSIFFAFAKLMLTLWIS